MTTAESNLSDAIEFTLETLDEYAWMNSGGPNDAMDASTRLEQAFKQWVMEKTGQTE